MVEALKARALSYKERFREGEEFTLGHMLVLSLLATIPLGIGLIVLKFGMGLIYSIFW